VSVETLQALNGELRGRTTPRGVSAYPLRLPRGAGPVLSTRLSAIPAGARVPGAPREGEKGRDPARFARGTR